MRTLRNIVIILLFLGLPATLLADVTVGGLPETAKWYFHADFEEMRSSEAGQHLYGWLQKEVFDDIREDVGVDFDKEVDTVTAFSAKDEGVVVVIDGSISQETQDKILAVGAASGSLDKLGSGNKSYYHIKDNGQDDDDGDHDHGNVDINVDGFDDGAYFTFAVKNKIIVASTEEDIQSLIANKGKVDVAKSQKGALFVLSAERNLVQAGVKADELGDDVGWDSNILRNTEQAALLISDEAGKIAIEAQLVTTEKEMADSLASIVRGLISLQIFNDDLDPEVASFLQNTSVEVDDKTLKLKVALDPELVVATLD
jgi:hypothetical protein